MFNGNERAIISAKEFGERLQKQRKNAGYKKPRNLALAICGFSPDEKGLLDTEQHKVAKSMQNIRNWERGDNFPSSIQELAKICNLLDCDPDYLLYEDSVYPRKEVKNAADLLNVSTAAIEALLHISSLDDAFVDEDGNTAELDRFMKPSAIMSALFESDELASLIMDLMRARSFIGLSRNSRQGLEDIGAMNQIQQERLERKIAELEGWANYRGFALLQGNSARDLYIQKAADRIKAFENRLTAHCENEISKDLPQRESASHQHESTNTEQVDSFCWDEFE